VGVIVDVGVRVGVEVIVGVEVDARVVVRVGVCEVINPGLQLERSMFENIIRMNILTGLNLI